MPSRYVARPFHVYAHEYRPGGAIIEGVYRIDSQAPSNVPKSSHFPQNQCAWTFARGRVQLVEPGDMVVDTIDGRIICKPETFDRIFAPIEDPATTPELQAV